VAAYTARRGGGRKRPATGWASLTPAELEVIRLAAAGLRNQAIAQRLFVAPGTVKTHLTHIFTKLGITTRTELAAQAATHELRTHQTTPLPCDDLRPGAQRTEQADLRSTQGDPETPLVDAYSAIGAHPRLCERESAHSP